MKITEVGELATLIRGDSKKYLAKMTDGSVDLIWTDPPYGHNQNDGDLFDAMRQKREKEKGNAPKGSRAKEGIRSDGRWLTLMNDGMDEANALAENLFRESARLLNKKAGTLCCCCGGGGPDPQAARWTLMMCEHLQFDQQVIWDKIMPGLGWRYRRSYEVILVGYRKGGNMGWYDKSAKIENVVRLQKIIPPSGEHPTVKPVELVRHFIKLHTKPGDLVVDPFMGGGSTAVACIELGRKFVGIELDPQFYELAVKKARAANANFGVNTLIGRGLEQKQKERFGDGKRRKGRLSALTE
jgi:DNA modification methylase